ncbi:MAG: Transaldolase, partial [uncultured Gemmatimonadaceae bacterium]
GFRPLLQAPRRRPVGLARLHHPHDPAQRRARADDPRGRAVGDDVEPDDLREGAGGGHRVRRAARRGAAGARRGGEGAGDVGAVRAGGDHRRARRLRPLPAGVRADRGRGRLRVDRGVARRGRPGRGHRGGGAPPLADGGPPERDGEGAGHRRGGGRRAAAHRRRHQRQRHAALLARRPPPRDRGLPGRARGARRPRPPDRPRGVGGELLREPRRQRDRQAPRRHRRRRGGRARRHPARPRGVAQGARGGRQREARLP